MQPRLTRSIQTAADATVPKGEPSSTAPFTVRLHEDSFQSYRCDPPSLEVEVEKGDLLRQFKLMTAMRRMEMAADQMYKAKLIRGFCHLAIGQVRVKYLIQPDCMLISTSGSCFCRSRGCHYA